MEGGNFRVKAAPGKKSNERNHNSIFIRDTNVYGPKGDIIVSALSREIPKGRILPCQPTEWGPDKIAAEEADRFKEIWARNNNLHDSSRSMRQNFLE